MALHLQILNGPRYGESLVLQQDTGVGRQAEQSFNDSNMSKIHAFFEINELQQWIVRDNNSKNGITVNGERCAERELKEGDLLEIGTTQFRVAAAATLWRPQLNQLLIEGLDKVRDEELALYSFRQIPVFQFVQGPQFGEKLVLEYGPRFFGGESEDIQLYEPYCPDSAFEVHRHTQGVLFLTKYPKIVLLNGKSVDKKILKKRDQIQIHNTILEIDFLNL